MDKLTDVGIRSFDVRFDSVHFIANSIDDFLSVCDHKRFHLSFVFDSADLLKAITHFC